MIFFKIKKKIRFYIFPGFPNRYYLFKDLKYILNKFKFIGTIIDIGCGQKSYESLFYKLSSIKQYHGIDFKDFSISRSNTGSQPDYYFDEEYSNSLILPFKNEEFDASVAFQVLEHHRDPDKMVYEMSRITKKGGYILITVPFIEGIHEPPHDYQRFTEFGLIELISKNSCEIVEIIKQGSLFSTIVILYIAYLNGFASKNKFCYILSIIIYPLFLFMQYSCLVLDKIFKSRTIGFNYLVLAKKK